MDHFQKLPEELVREIMGRTSPVDVARSAVISKWFKSVADSDVVWGRLLPSDWAEIVSRSVSPKVYATKKELCISLCRTPIFLDVGTLGFFVDKCSAKKCYIVGARELMSPWADNGWLHYQSHPDSRFSEVANFDSGWGLDIQGRIKARMLSPNTSYGAYLVYKLDGDPPGLRSLNTVVRLVDNDDENRDIAAATIVHLILPSARYRQSMQLINATLPLIRVDGWLEIHMGNFFNHHGDETEVEARLMDISRGRTTRRLIVQAIEFRPN